jgi:hypothetical protein
VPAPLTVRELATPVRKAVRKLGFKLGDHAEDAITKSALLPECATEAAILARLAGVPRTTVLTWMANARAKQAAIQQERLELLGNPSDVLVFVDVHGCVCSHRSEAVEAAAR